MSLHLVAYYQAATANAVLAPIPAVADGTVRVVANDVYVPKGMAQVLAVAALINSAAATVRAQLQAPSLRATLNYDIEPIGNGLLWGSSPANDCKFDAPVPLSENEPLEFWVQNGAAVVNQGLVWLGDGPAKSVGGRIYSVRATGSATLAAGVWVNTPLVFSQTLPAGNYQCVGLRAWGANLVAARLFSVGSPWRPGVQAVNAVANLDDEQFRLGAPGVLAEFANTTPPTMDCFGITDAAQVFILDLIKTA